MAKILAVMANPRKNSYTSQLLQGFLQAYQRKNPGDMVTELDVYQAEIPVIDGTVLDGWEKSGSGLTAEEQKRLAAVDFFTRQFMEADKVVIAAPMWNLQFPPMLLAYIATITVAGKTFAYSEHGWKGLVPDKPLQLIHVRGGVFSSGPAKAYDHAVPYLRSLCSLLGIQDFRTLLCEGIEANPQQAAAIFAKAMEEVKEAAENF